MDPMDIFTLSCWRHLEVYIPWSLAAPMQEGRRFYPADVSESRPLNSVMKWLQHCRFIELVCVCAQHQAVTWSNSIYRKTSCPPNSLPPKMAWLRPQFSRNKYKSNISFIIPDYFSVLVPGPQLFQIGPELDSWILGSPDSANMHLVAK